jgi:hypothetical protein
MGWYGPTLISKYRTYKMVNSSRKGMYNILSSVWLETHKHTHTHTYTNIVAQESALTYHPFCEQWGILSCDSVVWVSFGNLQLALTLRTPSPTHSPHVLQSPCSHNPSQPSVPKYAPLETAWVLNSSGPSTTSPMALSSPSSEETCKREPRGLAHTSKESRAGCKTWIKGMP